jgi:hypothetical protein
MPNWVSNSVRVTGNKEELKRFAEQAGRSYKQKRGELTPDGVKYFWADDEVNEHLSFWNFVRPDESILDEYWGAERQDLSLAEKLQHKTNHWYDWNVRNWGCKWDATDVCFEDWDGELAYDFETPWGFPYEAIKAMVEQYPTLTFSVRFLEEQGWGGEALGMNGEFGYTDEWDIPCTHEERMLHIGYCHCEEANEYDIEYLYDDCPVKMEVANA